MPPRRLDKMALTLWRRSLAGPVLWQRGRHEGLLPARVAVADAALCRRDASFCPLRRHDGTSGAIGLVLPILTPHPALADACCRSRAVVRADRGHCVPRYARRNGPDAAHQPRSSGPVAVHSLGPRQGPSGRTPHLNRSTGDTRMNLRLPAYILSHGGGPCHISKDRFRRIFEKLEQSLKRYPARLGRRGGRRWSSPATGSRTASRYPRALRRAWSMTTPAFRPTHIRSATRHPVRPR